LEALLVLQVSGVRVRPSRVRMPIAEQQALPMPPRLPHQPVELGTRRYVEGEVVQSRTQAVCRPALSVEERSATMETAPPAHSVVPSLVLAVAQLTEKPPPALLGGGQIGHPQLQVVQPPVEVFAPRRRTFVINCDESCHSKRFPALQRHIRGSAGEDRD